MLDADLKLVKLKKTIHNTSLGTLNLQFVIQFALGIEPFDYAQGKLILCM